MINVKDQVYAALSSAFSNVTDGYPSDWSIMPAVQLTEEDNRVSEDADGVETMSYLRFRIDIWDTKSTSASALEVDKVICPLGLRRTGCMDSHDDPKYKHKVMRYEGMIDTDTEMVSQERL